MKLTKSQIESTIKKLRVSADIKTEIKKQCDHNDPGNRKRAGAFVYCDCMGDIKAMNFHNSTELHGPALHQAEIKAMSQQQIILDYFKRYPDCWLTPHQVHEAVLPQALITSVRRSMTDLTTAKKLVKTNVKMQEKHGAVNHKWRLRGKPLQRPLF